MFGNSQHVVTFVLITSITIGVLLIYWVTNIVVATSSKKQIGFIKQLSSQCYLTTTTEWHALLNDNSLVTFQTFFRHATSERNSSYPFIAGDTLRAFADHIFDETTNVSYWIHRVAGIGRGDIVFLQSEKKMLEHFFATATFKQIRHPFVLITHNSDCAAPTKEFEGFLNNPMILAWFAQNPDTEHKKLFPIPIGVANARWSHGKVDSMKQAICLHRKPFLERQSLVYVNFQVETNKVRRSKALKWALSLVNITQKQSSSFENYLKELGNAKFVVSPPGNGLDCHRTWEAMLMGAIPIVLRSRLDPLFHNEDVLIVDDWNQITLDYLKSLEYRLILSQKVLARYWHTRILLAAGRK